MFSYHPDQGAIGKAFCFARGWQAYRGPDQSLSRAIVGWATSPSLYEGGYRNKSSFIGADWLGLDFDEGPSLLEIYNTFCDHIHVLGPTKSHQISKNGAPPCDRFRLWLKLPETITNTRDYEATLRQYVHRYDADAACVDAARLFWPCKEIYSAVFEGETADIVRAPEKEYVSDSPVFRGKIPYWVRDYLDGVFPPGRPAHMQRNFYVYKTAVWLTRNGWQEEEIVNIIMNSKLQNLPGRAAMKVFDVRKTVKSGILKASKI